MIPRLPEKQRGDCRDVVGDGHPSPMDDANTGDLTLIYKLLTRGCSGSCPYRAIRFAIWDWTIVGISFIKHTSKKFS